MKGRQRAKQAPAGIRDRRTGASPLRALQRNLRGHNPPANRNQGTRHLTHARAPAGHRRPVTRSCVKGRFTYYMPDGEGMVGEQRLLPEGRRRWVDTLPDGAGAWSQRAGKRRSFPCADLQTEVCLPLPIGSR